MALIYEEELLPESLDLCLQLQPCDIGVMKDLSEATDVTLHRLAHGQLCLILDSEVISSQTGIVHRICKDLSPHVLDGLEIMPPVSDRGSLLL